MTYVYWILCALFFIWGVKTIAPTRNHFIAHLQSGKWIGLITIIIIFFGGSAGFAYLALNS